MKNLKYSFLAIFILGMMSCNGDKFSAVKEIDFPEHTPLLAVTSNLLTENPNPNFGFVNSAFVGHSLGILDPSSYEVIDDATVEFYRDGNKLFDFDYDANNNNYLVPNSFELTPGEYKMEVSAPGYEMVSATQKLPSTPTVISSSYEFEKIPFDFDDSLYDLLKLKIQDPEDEENFYSFQLSYEIKNAQGEIRTEYHYTTTDAPLVEYGYDAGEIFPDITFNGNTYDVRLLQITEWILQPGEEFTKVFVDIYSFSKDFYFYDTSREKYWEASENPFAEPVLIHSNFDGGYGVFTLTNIKRYEHVF